MAKGENRISKKSWQSFCGLDDVRGYFTNYSYKIFFLHLQHIWHFFTRCFEICLDFLLLFFMLLNLGYVQLELEWSDLLMSVSSCSGKLWINSDKIMFSQIRLSECILIARWCTAKSLNQLFYTKIFWSADHYDPWPMHSERVTLTKRTNTMHLYILRFISSFV